MEFIELILTPKLDGVILKSPHHENVDGTLCITGHHLILSSRKEGVQELWLLHKNIDCIEKKENKPNPSSGSHGGSLILKCKDLRILQLDISSSLDLARVAQTLENLRALNDAKLQYPFFYRPMYNILEDGYTMFNPESEYAKVLALDDWRLSRVNQAYEVCESYPQQVVVPRSIDDDCLMASAGFRQGGRFPVLAYRHENGAVLLRSGQPLIGPQGRRCRQDERLLNAVLAPGKKGLIFDLRSPGLVAQQKAKGGGIESDSNYSQWRKVNRPMDKIDSLQLIDSFCKLMEVCNDKEVSSDKWLSRLESSGWLSHVLNALNTACTVAQCLHQDGNTVLVHGTRGQDATLLTTSLVQVILNPDCRTVRGLEALVEREWLQSGHPFASRHRHACYAAQPPTLRKASFATPTPPPTAAPVFLLFLDCLRQLLEQFPASFEFTQALLVKLYEHSYFSEYGTFLADSDCLRQALGTFSLTTSLWSRLNRPQELAELLSPLYEPTHAVIWPSVAPMSLVLWEELYLRWVVDLSALQYAEDEIRQIKERDQFLRSHAARLRRQLVDLATQVNYPPTDLFQKTLDLDDDISCKNVKAQQIIN